MLQETKDVLVLVGTALPLGWLAWDATQRRVRPPRRVIVRVAERPHPSATRRRSRRDLLALLLLPAVAVPFASVSSASAQAVRYGVVMDIPRARLDSVWSDDPHQVERAYCVTDYSVGVSHVSHDPATDDTIFRVFRMQPANVRSATPNTVDFECPPGVPEMHVHTPSTCIGDDIKTCVAGGLNAFSCQPSRQDLEKLVRRGDPFAVIQCDRRDFRFYYPSEYVPPPAQTLAANAASNKPDPNRVQSSNPNPSPPRHR